MEKTIEQQRKEWLDSHLQPYINDPKQRATENYECRYFTKDGRCCIVGQDIADKKAAINIPASVGVGQAEVMNKLPQSTIELGFGFLRECQILHDVDEHWNENGLSALGKVRYNQLVFKYCTT